MFKVLLLVTTMSGMPHQVGFETMNECLEARDMILEQAKTSNVIEVFCLPNGNSDYQMRQFDIFFTKFMETVQKIRNMENR